MARLERRLPDLDDSTRSELLQTLRRVTDKLVHQPTIRAKELGDRSATSYAAALAELFALDQEAVDAMTRPVVPEEAHKAPSRRAASGEGTGDDA
jgi:glutamyl-tRNA reductase